MTGAESARMAIVAAKEAAREKRRDQDVIFNGEVIARVSVDVTIRDDDPFFEKREEVCAFVNMTAAGRRLLPKGWNK